jgi:hypothetical protein
VLDLAAGTWRRLPDPPDELVPTGLLTPSGGHLVSERGLLLDTRTDRWIRIPKLDEPDGSVQSRTVVAAGRDLFVFGGGRFPPDRYGGELINDAWIWSPPA